MYTIRVTPESRPIALDTILELYKYMQGLERAEQISAEVVIYNPKMLANYKGYLVQYPQLYYSRLVASGACYRNYAPTPFYDNPDIEFDEFYDQYPNHIQDATRPYVNATYFSYALEPGAYIDTINIPPGEDLYVRAPMGCGKTTAVVGALRDFPSDTTLLVISPRRTITSTIHRKFIEAGIKINNYMLSKNLDRDSARLIISPNSLTKLSTFRTYDYILIDEIMLLLEYIFSKHPRRRKKMLLILEQLLTTCGQLICSDAYLVPRVIDILTDHRKTESRLVEYTRPDTRKYEFINQNTFYENIGRDVLYKRRAYIFCETKRVARTIADKLRLMLDESDGDLASRVLLVTADTSDKVSLLADPNVAFVNYAFVVASPVILSGLDFTVDYFDRVYGLYTETVLDAISLIQMSGRIRRASTCWFVNMRKTKARADNRPYSFDAVLHADMSPAVRLEFDQDMNIVPTRTLMYDLYELVAQYRWLTKGTLAAELGNSD